MAFHIISGQDIPEAMIVKTLERIGIYDREKGMLANTEQLIFNDEAVKSQLKHEAISLYNTTIADIIYALEKGCKVIDSIKPPAGK